MDRYVVRLPREQSIAPSRTLSEHKGGKGVEGEPELLGPASSSDQTGSPAAHQQPQIRLTWRSTHSAQPSLAPRSNPPQSFGDGVTSLRCDSEGALSLSCASVSSSARDPAQISLHDVRDIESQPTSDSAAGVQPLFAFGCHKATLCAWDSHDENCGLPYKIFKLGRRAVADLCAATDLVGFPSHARHAFAAATDTGVAICARDASCSPSFLAPPGPPRVDAVEVCADGFTVVGAVGNGKIALWDVRGGRDSAVVFGGNGFYQHAQVKSASLWQALERVPGLVSQAGIPSSRMAAMRLDPHDERRLGFLLKCGWAGVLDLVDDRVTHLFCPSSGGELPTSSLHGQPSQSCAWTSDGQYFCTSGWPVRILDFRPSPLAACAVPTDDIAGSPEDGAPGRASFAIAVPASVSALDVCRTTDSIVAGTVGGDVLLLSQQRET
eukprot:jgi/Astpho2/2112/Aster-x1041